MFCSLQLAFALRWLKPGGMLLTRCYLSLELIDFHYVAALLEYFTTDESHVDALPLNKLPETIMVYKPISEFPTRHTYV